MLFFWRLSDVCLSVCLSVAYIGPKSRTKRPRKTKMAQRVAHVTRVLDTTFKVKRSKVKVTRPLCSPLCWRVRRLQRWAWERVGRGKLLLRCRLLGGGRRFGAHGGGEGRMHTMAAARLQLVMRPSSLGGGRILRCTLSVRLSVCLSVCPSVPCLFTLEHRSRVLRCFRQPCGRAVSFVLFTSQGRISYGHLGRTSLFILCFRQVFYAALFLSVLLKGVHLAPVNGAL